MGKIAFLFPGQGSQAVGMGKNFYENYAVAKKVYDKADKVLCKNITKLCFEGPEEDLKQTINTQPCIVTTSIAALEVVKNAGIKADYCAGHSLGEYCAMYYAGVMDLETTLNAIQKRAELMSSTQRGCMAAVLNAPEGALDEALKEGSKIGYVDVANYNSPVQIVITGDDDAIKKASEVLLEKGARKVVPLAISGAFHSKYMSNAGKEFEGYVSSIKLRNADVPVVTNVDAQITTNSEDFRNKMPRQIYSSVYWTQTIQNMAEKGVDTFIELGNGRVLSGLNKKILPNANVYNVYDKESLEATLNALNVLV